MQGRDITHKLLFEWDLAALAAALHIPPADVEIYFRDGRRISFVLERRIRDSFDGWHLAPSEGAGYDLVDDRGEKWEVRSVSNSIYFCPSYMVGSGRKFDESGFFRKLDTIDGYICSDIATFPKVPVYVIPSDLIRRLYVDGKLGPTTLIRRAKFYSMVVPELDAIDSR
jgi:hypothetical protein